MRLPILDQFLRFPILDVNCDIPWHAGGVAVPTPLYMAPPAAYPTAAQAVGLHATQESTPSPFEAGQASSSGSHDRLDAAEELLQRLSMRTSPYDEGRLAADPNAFADLLPDQIVNVKQAQFVKEVLAAAPSQDIQTVSPEDSATSLTHFVPKVSLCSSLYLHEV